MITTDLDKDNPAVNYVRKLKYDGKIFEEDPEIVTCLVKQAPQGPTLDKSRILQVLTKRDNSGRQLPLRSIYPYPTSLVYHPRRVLPNFNAPFQWYQYQPVNPYFQRFNWFG